MDGFAGHYAKWNKSDREIQILYDITYMWNLKKTTNQWIQQKKDQIHRYREQTSGYKWGEGRGGGAVIRNILTKKSPRADGFTGEFCQTFTKELTRILLKLFQNITEGGTLLNSFYKVNIMLIQNQTKMSQKAKL